MSQIIGVLWEKDLAGMKYYSGYLNDIHGRIRIAVFPNNHKDVDSQPDMNIVLSENNFADKKDEDSGKAAKSKGKKQEADSDQEKAPF